jgi:hypothetical protein
MGSTYLPSREADLLSFSLNFGTKITATPTVYGLTAAQATTYMGLHDAFASAMTVLEDPMARSPGNVALKNAAKQSLVENLRLLAGIVQAAPGTTNPMRVELRLSERHLEPTPIPAPAMSPLLIIASVVGYTVKVLLRAEADDTSHRGKPEGVDGATVLSYVGAQPPADVSAWKLEGVTSRTSFDVSFPATLEPGTKVWLTAYWFSPSKHSGPACTPISTNLQGGALSQAA